MFAPEAVTAAKKVKKIALNLGIFFSLGTRYLKSVKTDK